MRKAKILKENTIAIVQTQFGDVWIHQFGKNDHIEIKLKSRDGRKFDHYTLNCESESKPKDQDIILVIKKR